MILRGIRHRPIRSLVVFALAMCAAAAAVMMPSYTSAAQHSLLLDELRRLPPSSVGMRVTHLVDGDKSVDTNALLLSIHAGIEAGQGLDLLREPIRFSHTDTEFVGASHSTRARLAYRDNVCNNVEIVSGVCDAAHGMVLMSKWSADHLGMDVGDRILVKSPSAAEGTTDTSIEISGLYVPKDPGATYWGRGQYFSHGVQTDGSLRLDSLLVTDISAAMPAMFPAGVGIDYRLDIPQTTLDTMDVLVAAISRLSDKGELPHPNVGNAPITVQIESSLPSVATSISHEQTAIATSVPIVAVPMLLMCWFVLYLVMSRLASERAEQVGLAKLRGQRSSVLVAVCVGESLVLILVALIPGTLLGIGIVETLAKAMLAPGSSFDWFTAAAVAIPFALLGAFSAAFIAAFPILGRDVPELLRRVSVRRTWRAGIGDGIVITLATVAVWQLTSQSGISSVGFLVTPLLALVLGIAVARTLVWWAGDRLPVSAEKGHLSSMLAMAALARRGESRRVALLVTVALALLTFGVSAWEVGARNRDVVAGDTIGAPTVYRLSGSDPQTMMDFVDEHDPDGDTLSAVVRSFERFGSKDFTILGIQTNRMANVAYWHDTQPETIDKWNTQLRPTMPDPLTITGRLTVTVDVETIESDRPMRLIARVVDGTSTVSLRLGEIREGLNTYHSDNNTCQRSCRLISIGAERYPGDLGNIKLDMTIEKATDSGQELPVTDCLTWRRGWSIPADAQFDVTCGTTLRLTANTDRPTDLLAEYATAPDTLPALLAGDAPTNDPKATTFTFPAAHGHLQKYEIIDTVDVLPRAGARAMLVDINYMNLLSQSVSSLADRPELSYEIWSNQPESNELVAALAGYGLNVASIDSHHVELQRLDRSSSALAINLYLVAAAASLVLVMGGVLMTNTSAATPRGLDIAALRLVGVSWSDLRTAIIREQVYWMGVPMLAGILSGGLGLVLVLPKLVLVTTKTDIAPLTYLPTVASPLWVFALTVAALATVTVTAVRTQLRFGRPSTLRAATE